MEDKINQITEQMNQVKAEMDERMDQVLNGYQNQIDDKRTHDAIDIGCLILCQVIASVHISPFINRY